MQAKERKPRSSTRSDWLGLSGRLAVVIGGASGIGAAIAEALADAGCQVVLADRDIAAGSRKSAALSAAGYSVSLVEVDVCDHRSVAALHEAIRSKAKCCDILVNAAGIMRPGQISANASKDWQAVLDVNLTGAFNTITAFLPGMIEAGGGAIVNIASIAASHPQTGGGSYSASKAGLVALTKQVAIEAGGAGVRCNAISPGMVDTPLSASFNEQPDVLASRQRFVPRRVIGRPEEIADAAVYLASEKASFINGVNLAVDGGMDGMLMDLLPRPGLE